MSLSNASQVIVSQVETSISGKFSCEVSADAPTFHTMLVSSDMEIVGKWEREQNRVVFLLYIANCLLCNWIVLPFWNYQPPVTTKKQWWGVGLCGMRGALYFQIALPLNSILKFAIQNNTTIDLLSVINSSFLMMWI